ncbi:MAG: type II toxin-antitoxin system Phd/YefM family antitoxin [Candidatus Moranbacteria bacterium]|nr:type II toxin-antitoxin system Phd/YefM family antitoxin [Candidatus Moranbacteria bacterium]
MRAKTTISISEARKKIFDIAEEVQKPGVYYTFTEKGRPKTVLMSYDEFDSLMETLEIMSNPKIMKDIKQAEEEYKRGEYVTLDQLKKELGYGPKAFMLADKGKKKYKAKRKK